ncbi:hypothetical protein BGZ76_005919, partial [Entomortierella beljakovae]
DNALIGFERYKLGAVNALEDAVILANCLYEVESFTQVSIDSALSDYKSQRYKHAKYQVETSAGLGKVIYGRTWVEKMLRKIVFGYMPKWLENINAAKAAEYRPQLTFLPKVPKRGTFKFLPQKESKRQHWCCQCYTGCSGRRQRIYELAFNSFEDIEAILTDYKDQRYSYAKSQVANSADIGRVLYGQTWFDMLVRKIDFGFMPK